MAKPSEKSVEYSRGSLGNAIRAYFDKVGVENAAYDKALEIAQSILPTTKFNKSHFSWYKNNYRDRNDLPSAREAAASAKTAKKATAKKAAKKATEQKTATKKKTKKKTA